MQILQLLKIALKIWIQSTEAVQHHSLTTLVSDSTSTSFFSAAASDAMVLLTGW